MANKHLSRNPHSLRGRKDIWWYEEVRGIAIYTRQPSGNVTHFIIPWLSIRPALARKDKPKDV